MKRPGRKSGEAQRCRTTESAVGDQHPTGLTETLIPELQIKVHVINGNAAAGSKCFGTQRQAEQRGNRRHQLMTEGLRKLSTTGMTTGGQHQLASLQWLL